MDKTINDQHTTFTNVLSIDHQWMQEKEAEAQSLKATNEI